MRTALAVLALATLIATPARAEVTTQSDNGFAVKHVVTVAVDPDSAFAMLRTPAKWWDKEHIWTGNADNLYLDAQAGGCFCELIPNDATTESGAPQRTLRGSVQHMQILYVDPGKLLRLSGALGPLQGEAMTGTMTITLAPIKGGSRLTFEYAVGGFMRMPQAEMATAVDGVIGAQASRLAMALGPLVGGGAALPAPAQPKGDPVLETDSPLADPEEESRVSDLVTDLAPDDVQSDDVQSDDAQNDAAQSDAAQSDAVESDDAAPRAAQKPAGSAPAATRRTSPDTSGARPSPRRASDRDEGEGGR